MRFATGVDDDLRPFYDRFRGDPVIGRAVRAHPRLRVRRQPDPWEALFAAITEQLIEFERAVAIQRRMIAVSACRCPDTGPARRAGRRGDRRRVAGAAASFDLAPKRAIACAARGRGRVGRRPRAMGAGRSNSPSHGARRLLTIPRSARGRSRWSPCTASGRYDVVPAGDLGFLKIVGRLITGHPKARADEAEVRGFFAPYGEWKGLAGEYLALRAAAARAHSSPDSPGRALARQELVGQRPRRVGGGCLSSPFSRIQRS